MQSLKANVATWAPSSARRTRQAQVVSCSAVNNGHSAFDHAKNMALVAGMSVMLLAEPSAALAKDKPVGGQGELLDQILEQQKKGEIKAVVIKAAPKPAAEKAVYGQDKKKAAPKPAASKPAVKKTSAKKETPKPSFSAKSEPLKFSSKAASGTQGSAPPGLELPVPKGASSAPAKKVAAPKTKPAAPKPAATTPKPAASKKEVVAPKPAASKPAAATENPLAKKAKTAKAAAAGASIVAGEKVVEKIAAPKASAPKADAPSSLSLSNSGVQAGAVAAAEVVGLVVASSVVNSILTPKKN